MNGFRFYADIPGTAYDPETSSFPRGHLPKDITVERLAILADAGERVNVIALATDRAQSWHDGRDRMTEAIVALTAAPDAPVCGSSVGTKYLKGCRRIPERVARRLHPSLFDRLDSPC